MTAPTKPTIDEQIARQLEVMANLTGTDVDIAILSTLRAHKAITEAERPEPVAYRRRSNWGDRWEYHEAHAGVDPKELPGFNPLYGPDLLDAYNRMRVERDAATGVEACCQEWHTCEKRCAPLAENWRTAAKTAERQLAELQQDAEIGRKWRENSSLEEWFPFTSAQLAELKAKHDALAARLRQWAGNRDMKRIFPVVSADLERIADALTATQQEPVAWMYVTRYGNKVLSFQRIPDAARHDYYSEYPLIFKDQSSYAKIFDTINGTPCEQIRFQQKKN